MSLSGGYLDLLDPELPVITDREVSPGEVVWFRDLDHDPEPYQILASAGRIRDLDQTEGALSYVCEAPANLRVITALRVPEQPREVVIDGEASGDWRHDQEFGVLWVRHPGAPRGTAVRIT